MHRRCSLLLLLPSPCCCRRRPLLLFASPRRCCLALLFRRLLSHTVGTGVLPVPVLLRVHQLFVGWVGDLGAEFRGLEEV
jgi:hypothetical protein